MIGDVNSTARGSGARFNDGKPPMELVPAWIVADYYDKVAPDCIKSISTAYRHLAAFVETRNPNHLYFALAFLKDPLRDAARVFGYGAKKYAAWNWLKGMPWSVPLACATRHYMAIREGEDTDPESGLPHEGHFACNVIMLIQYTESYLEGDDLPPKEDK